MMSLPGHPDDDADVTETPRWTRGRLVVIALVGIALIAIIVVHAAGIVGS